MSDPRDDAIIKAVREQADVMYARLAGEFGPKHDLIQQDNALLRRHIADLGERFTQLERRIDDIERQTGFNLELAKAAAANATAETPDPPGLSLEARPAAIDRACAADPADGPVMVLVPDLGLEVEPEPGSDPEAVWPAAVGAIDAEGSGRRGRRSR